MDRLLDEECAGPAYMRMPAVAQIVMVCIRKGAPADYRLHPGVVMPKGAWTPNEPSLC